LAEAGIGTGIHYPVPLHLQKAYERLGYRAGDFPVAERVAGGIVSLPMFPGLTRGSQERVVENILEYSGKLPAVAATGSLGLLNG